MNMSSLLQFRRVPLTGFRRPLFSYQQKSFTNSLFKLPKPHFTRTFRTQRAYYAQRAIQAGFFRSRIFPALGLAGLLGGSYYGYQRRNESEEKDIQLIPLPMKEPEQFVHPYDNEHWLTQLLYRTIRCLYLSVIFTPACVAGLAAKLTGSDTLREIFLDILVKSLETAGCTFQKFGQWLSMRPDMFPADVIDALSKLRSEAPSHSFQHTRKEIKASFGKELEEIFEEFSEEPVASGTCAQVHQARLKPEYALEGGQVDVAVKIRHPNVVWETFADLDLVFQFVESSVNLIHMTFPFGQEDFRELMQQQIDFKWEAYNLVKFNHLFDGEELIKFPDVSLDFLSPSVLIETWMPGKPVVNMLESFGDLYKEQAGKLEEFLGDCDAKLTEKKKKLAAIVHDMSMKMFLRDNFMHGDLHGGNVLLAEDGSLTVIDTGITTSIQPDWQPMFNLFLKYLCAGDHKSLTNTLLGFHEGDLSEETKSSFREAMTKTTKKFVANPGIAPGGGIVDLGDFIGEILFNLSSNDVHLRSDIAASIQSMSISEGLIRMLDPEYDVCKRSVPYFLKYRV